MNKRIEQIIEHLGISKAEFSKEIDIQRSSISHLTSGRNNPSLDIVLKILSRYPQYSTDWLLFGKGSMLKKEEDNIFNQNVNPPTDNINKKSNLHNNNNDTNVYNNKQENKSTKIVDNNKQQSEANNVNKTPRQSNVVFDGTTSPEQILILFDDSTFKTYNKRD